MDLMDDAHSLFTLLGAEKPAPKKQEQGMICTMRACTSRYVYALAGSGHIVPLNAELFTYVTLAGRTVIFTLEQSPNALMLISST